MRDTPRETRQRYAGSAVHISLLRWMTAIAMFFIFIFMAVAVLQSHPEDTMTGPADEIEIFFDYGWRMATIDPGRIPASGQDRILAYIEPLLSEGNGQEVTLPYTGKAAAGDIIVLYNTIPEEFSGQTMHFASADTNVRVILDGAVIYQYGLGTGSSLGVHENVIDLPTLSGDGSLWIELIPSSQDAAILDGSVTIRPRHVAVIGLLANDIADISCCLMIMIMSIILFTLALIRRYTGQSIRGEVFLGAFGLIACIYCFIATNTLSIFYDLDGAYVMQEYLLMMLPLFLARYLDQNLHKAFPHRFSVLFWLACVNSAAQILIQLFGLWPIEDLSMLSALGICAICLTAMVSLLQYRRRYEYRQILLAALAISVLLAGEAADLAGNVILEGAYTHMAIQYSMTLFSILMAVLHTLQLAREYRLSAEESARLLQERMAVTEQQNVLLAQAKEDADCARQEAQAANEARGRFLAQMSHEIRTPINAVLGMDEMILRETKEQTIKEYAMDIYLAGQTLLALVNDILDLSKIDSGKMEIVPAVYDPRSLIHDLTNMTAQRASAKGLRLEIDIDPQTPCRLYGDDVRIRQVLTNILTNSVKYTHTGSIWLRVRCLRADETALLTFEVEDTGIGIKAEDLPKLCAVFERIEEGRNRNIEGSGLGMSITVQLLALLGSKLQVESTYGKGSRFYFQLEQKIIDPEPVKDTGAIVRQTAKEYTYRASFCAPEARILVVDDNAVNRRVFRSLLKKTRIQVTDAESGMHCLDLVQKEHFDLIFLDHMMPEMDGLETLYCIRTLPEHPCRDTPIIVLTANAISGARERYLAEGFDDFLSKPIVSEKLEHMIQRLLPQHLINHQMDDSHEMDDNHKVDDAHQTDDSHKVDDGHKADDSHEMDDSLKMDGAPGSFSGGAPDDLPHVEGLDWAYAWMHLQDREILEYTLRQFYAQILPAADTLEELVQHADPEGLEPYRIQVHAMKGLAATIGLLPLSGLAQILEHAARDKDTGTIVPLTPVFLKEWRSYHQRLQDIFGIGQGVDKELTDPSVIQALVEMVRLSMQEMDIDSADRAMEQLQSYRYPDDIAREIGKLAESVTSLDPENTSLLADLLIDKLGTR